MVEDRPEEIEPSPDSGRAKRAPPTIDLEATEISGELISSRFLPFFARRSLAKM